MRGVSRVFLDTEFNGFGGELISMALVCEEGCHEFYEVLAIPANPDPFVAEHVIPKLGKPAIGEEAFDAVLADFLSEFGDNDVDHCEIVADWPADFEHLSALLSRAGRELGWKLPIECTMRLVRGDSTIVPANPHNALSDALALKDWWQRTQRPIEERSDTAVPKESIMKTAEQLIDDIEARVRPTIAPTFTMRDGEPVESLEGRISQVDFDTLVKLTRTATSRERERCAMLHENVNTASDDERHHGVPGAGAMGAVIQYRDMIRAG